MIPHLEELKKYERIVVTGPHRAGTTITARILAEELGYEFKIENEVEKSVGWSKDNFVDWLRDQHKITVQGASAFTFLPAYLNDEGTAIVCVRRPLKDIISSRMRAQLKRLTHPDQAYSRWDHLTADKQNCFEINYDDLKDHELFHDDRKDWKPRQIEPDGDEVTA